MAEPQRLINTHDQLIAAGGGIAITTAHDPGRGARACGWAIYRVNAHGVQLVTNKDAAWYEHGRKVFYWSGTTRQIALDRAKAWVLATYGEAGPWKRNTLSDYVPAAIFKKFPIPKREKNT